MTDARIAAAVERCYARATGTPTVSPGPERDVGALLTRAWQTSRATTRQVHAWIRRRLDGAPVPDLLTELDDDVWTDLVAWVDDGCPQEGRP